MREYLQHRITMNFEFRSPKYNILLCSDAQVIFKKEIDYDDIS